jgi:signal transduction histidine kinase
MSALDAAATTYRELREMCLSDPLAARRRLTFLLDSNAPLFAKIIECAGGPDDSRLRQTIARSLQRRPEVQRYARTLQDWHARERDEFTRSAIGDALAVSSTSSNKGRRLDEPADLATTYRYVAGRLRHRILNAMPRTGLNVTQVRAALLQNGVFQAENVLRCLSDLANSLRAIEAAVDFGDADELFMEQPINLSDWLQRFAVTYQRAYADVTIRNDIGDEAGAIVATNFLLETILRNLCDNSRQAASGHCIVTFSGAVKRRSLAVRVVDNGPGLAVDDAERAFQFRYSSTHGAGRGHLEVEDAMRRLGGSARVERLTEAGNRIVLTFPLPRSS